MHTLSGTFEIERSLFFLNKNDAEENMFLLGVLLHFYSHFFIFVTRPLRYRCITFTVTYVTFVETVSVSCSGKGDAMVAQRSRYRTKELL